MQSQAQSKQLPAPPSLPVDPTQAALIADQCRERGQLNRRIKNTMGATTAVARQPMFCVNIHNLHCYSVVA